MADCYRECGSNGIPKTDKNGQTFWRHRSSPTTPGAAQGDVEEEEEHAGIVHDRERADSDTLNAVYTALIQLLPLYEDHGKALVARGFTLEAVHALGYRSFPAGNDAQRVVDELEKTYGDKLLTVPGFDREHRDLTLTDGTCIVVPSIRLSGSASLLLPQRDEKGRIVGMMLRLDDQPVTSDRKRPRYLPLTSYTSSGCGAKIGVHVPLYATNEGPKVRRVIEGIFKSDLATLRTGLLTLGIPNGGRWLQGIKTAEALGAEGVLLCPDADTRRNAGICSTLTRAADGLAAKGSLFGIETWPVDAEHHPKGLDDVIVAGKHDEVTVSGGVDAWRIIKAWLTSSGAPADPHVIARVTLDGVIEKTEADASYPFSPNIAEGVALLEEGSVETQRLLASLRKILKSAWKDFEKKLKEARQKKQRLVRAGQRREAEAQGPEVLANEYAEVNGTTCLVVHDPKLGTNYKQVANFVAKIEREVTLDDGVTASKLFTISGKLASGAALPTTEVSASSWTDKSWLAERWGSRPVVEAGRDSWGHLLAAIQTCSSPSTATTFAHTGWRKLGDRWVYLMPGGSVGCIEADVRNPDDAGRYGFPTGEATKDEVTTAVRRSLGIINIGDPTVTVPVLSAAYTAPLASILEIDVGVWVAGVSGSRKSGLVGITGCHFGRFSYCSLPSSWTSTVNSIEGFLFRTKDMLGIVDNYLPGDRDAVTKVGRIVHQIGDRAGRGRMAKDSSAMPARPPRGLMLATGEDVPVASSDSTVGRLIIVRVNGGSLPIQGIIEASQNSEDYGVAMRAYLEWLAADYEVHANKIREHREQLTRQFGVVVTGHAVHPRTARNVASIGVGLMTFLKFARETQAITPEEHEDIRNRADKALIAVARAQGGYRENATPTDRYLSSLRAMLTQGLVTISPRYEDLDVEKGIGWEGDDGLIYLHPDLSWRAIESFHSQGQKWSFSKVGMHQSLIEVGIVQRGEAGRADTKRSVGAAHAGIRVLLVHREYLAEALPARVNLNEFSAEDVAETTPALPN